MNLMRFIERALSASGVAALVLFGVNYGSTQISAAEDMEQFSAAIRSLPGPDMSLWSSGRVAAFRSQETSDVRPIGTLHIERAGIEAPIYSGSADRILDRGIGWIEGTAHPGGDGNVGLAAHRDGFFRGLKDVEIGDRITTVTWGGESVYEITALEIVGPRDVHVLAPTDDARLTLVTCHPFYFVGAAPNRFIVHAELVRRDGKKRVGSSRSAKDSAG